ncbi:MULTISPECIES: ParA family protein [Peptostreptococcaceae]|uniref:ParA family protein n=1 Tax=Peptostreptococcaceae TaxID=186804 RepID=UPI0008218076|nr:MULTISPECIES: ParA family protein [Peptostreptococcaceae]SCI50447.1 Sporulation initiation inhibitor protein soj [uncultured Clostridium sp.]MCE4921894.1 ParA family protein [Clostridioides difficile]MCH1964634.1 ParA family protein [Paeniclostridium sordellii]MDM0309432.1 ParA family protein [Clostridioides difficile]MDM0378946.1 ParA family protein [Clostridioides difficile]
MKVISCYNLKGGVGKTTINNLLALDISQTKIKNENGEMIEPKILMIDADEQANLTSFFYNNMHQDKTIVDALINDLSAEEVIIKAPNENYPNVDFIPSNIKMSIMAELISTRNAKEKVAMRWFIKNIETLKKYTHILIDLSPGTNIVNRNMLYISDSILGICKYTDTASIEGFATFLERYKLDAQELELPKMANIRVLMNQYTTRKTSTANIFDAYLENFPSIKELLLDTKVHESVSIKNAILYNTSISDYINDYGGNERSLEDMKKLTKELIEKGMI